MRCRPEFSRAARSTRSQPLTTDRRNVERHANFDMGIMLMDPTKIFVSDPNQVSFFLFALMPQLVACTKHVLQLSLQRPSARSLAGEP